MWHDRVLGACYNPPVLTEPLRDRVACVWDAWPGTHQQKGVS